MPAEVTLGGVTVQVYAQKHAYLEHRAIPVIQTAVQGGEGLEPSGILGWLGDSAYEVLAVLIPSLATTIPEHQFRGYATKAAFEAGEFDPAAVDAIAGCPTIAEIEEAYSVAFEVNGLRSLIDLGKAVAGPDGLRLLRAQMLNVLVTNISSPTSPPTIGESLPESSGTSLPTSTVSGDSPSTDSAA